MTISKYTTKWLLFIYIKLSCYILMIHVLSGKLPEYNIEDIINTVNVLLFVIFAVDRKPRKIVLTNLILTLKMLYPQKLIPATRFTYQSPRKFIR